MSDTKIKKDLKKLRDDYYWLTKRQRVGAWKEKDFKKAERLRKKEKINFEKWKLLDGLVKEMEKNVK